MKKRIVKITFAVFIPLIITFLCIEIVNTIDNAKSVENKIKVLQNFYLHDVNGDVINTRLLPKQPILLLFFSTECKSCQEEIKLIIKSYDSYRDISILLISNQPIDLLKEFHKNNKLALFDNISVIIDDKLDIINAFDIKVIPSIFIYNEKRELIYKHKGEIDIRKVKILQSI